MQVQLLCEQRVPFGEEKNSYARPLSGPGSESGRYSEQRQPSQSTRIPSQITSTEFGILDGFLDNLARKRYSAELALDMVRKEEVLSVMDMIQSHLDKESSHHDLPLRKTCIECLLLLNKQHSTLPTTIYLDKVTRDGQHAVSGGGFADIYKGRLEDKRTVCLKVLRVYTATYDEKKLFKQLSKEVLIWRQLQHPNILQFLGITKELFKPSYCIISPWMVNGDVIRYSQVKKTSLDDRVRMMHEISKGVRYLHEHHPPIIHSDIKGLNILVSDDGNCCLADFGLATIENDMLEGQVHLSTSQAVLRGSVPWLAPELMNPDHIGVPSRTTRDIYALGCTIFELLTGSAPFSEKKMDFQIIMEVLNGSRPVRPVDCPDWLWEVVESCWKEDFQARPTAAEVTSRLSERITQRDISFMQNSQSRLLANVFVPSTPPSLSRNLAKPDHSPTATLSPNGRGDWRTKFHSPTHSREREQDGRDRRSSFPVNYFYSGWGGATCDQGTNSSRISDVEDFDTAWAPARDIKTPSFDNTAMFEESSAYQQRVYRWEPGQSASSLHDPKITASLDTSPTKPRDPNSSRMLAPMNPNRVYHPTEALPQISMEDDKQYSGSGYKQHGRDQVYRGSRSGIPHEAPSRSLLHTSFRLNDSQVNEIFSPTSRKRCASLTPLEDFEHLNKRPREDIYDSALSPPTQLSPYSAESDSWASSASGILRQSSTPGQLASLAVKHDETLHRGLFSAPTQAQMFAGSAHISGHHDRRSISSGTKTKWLDSDQDFLLPPAGGIQYASMAALPKPTLCEQLQRRRGRLPKETTDFLKAWLHRHSDHPYPSEEEKKQLCHATGLSMSGVSNWMINARRRILTPVRPSTNPTTTAPFPPTGRSASLSGLLDPMSHRAFLPADSLQIYHPLSLQSMPGRHSADYMGSSGRPLLGLPQSPSYQMGPDSLEHNAPQGRNLYFNELPQPNSMGSGIPLSASPTLSNNPFMSSSPGTGGSFNMGQGGQEQQHSDDAPSHSNDLGATKNDGSWRYCSVKLRSGEGEDVHSPESMHNSGIGDYYSSAPSLTPHFPREPPDYLPENFVAQNADAIWHVHDRKNSFTDAPQPLRFSAVGPTNLEPRRRGQKKLTKEGIDFLKAWLHSHADRPNLTEEEKEELCRGSGLDMSQLETWFQNARRRVLDPARASTAHNIAPLSTPMPQSCGPYYCSSNLMTYDRFRRRQPIYAPVSSAYNPSQSRQTRSSANAPVEVFPEEFPNFLPMSFEGSPVPSQSIADVYVPGEQRKDESSILPDQHGSQSTSGGFNHATAETRQNALDRPISSSLSVREGVSMSHSYSPRRSKQARILDGADNRGGEHSIEDMWDEVSLRDAWKRFRTRVGIH